LCGNKLNNAWSNSNRFYIEICLRYCLIFFFHKGGGDDKAFIWRYEYLTGSSNPATIISVHELIGHTDTVTSVGFNFDGSLALTGSYDGTVRIWKTNTGIIISIHLIISWY
jgi:WD40 repeat protein